MYDSILKLYERTVLKHPIITLLLMAALYGLATG